MNYDPITHQEALKIRADVAALSAGVVGAGKRLALLFQTNFTTSRTLIVPQDGILVFRAMGAGGSGAKGASATGGYSGSWGVKAIRIKKNDSVTVSIGAAGAGVSTANSNGNAGGNSTVVVGGVTYIANGGPAGVYNSASAIPNGPAPSANWDAGILSVKPGWAAGIVTGGAGVDILAQGNNATTSASTSLSGGGGTGSASVAQDGGGALGIANMLGQISPLGADGLCIDGSNGEWGISFYGGSGGRYQSGAPGYAGGNGGGGSATTSGHGGNGTNGGGGGSSSGTNYNGGKGGLGGGGGATTTGIGFSGTGGDGFAHLKLFVEI